MHTAAPGFASLIEQTRFLRRIQAVVFDTLPAAARMHVQVAGYEAQRLRIHVSNGSWGTRLRYMRAAIAQTLAQRMRLAVDHVDIRVRALAGRPDAPASPARILSAPSRDQIARTATYIDDPALAEALNRLARAGRMP